LPLDTEYTTTAKDPPGLTGVESTVDQIGLGILTATVVGIGVHAVASAVAGIKELLLIQLQELKDI